MATVQFIYHKSFGVNYTFVLHSTCIASLLPLDENSNTEHHRLNLSSSPEAGCTDTEDERSPKRKFSKKISVTNRLAIIIQCSYRKHIIYTTFRNLTGEDVYPDKRISK